MSTSLVWFITGTSAGLGLSLSLHALSKGDRVIATVRSKTKSAKSVALLEARGATVLELDVVESATISGVVQAAKAVHGRIDVLINNAGYSLIGAVEDLTDDEADQQFQTNFYGPLRIIRAMLPIMRGQGTGTIVNISSIAGQDGLPSCGMYAASKFALEGLSESLAIETAPFGISVLIVEPGAFRTNFLSAIQTTSVGVSAPYKGGPVEAVLNRFDQLRGTQKGDPELAAARIWEVVTGSGMAGHLKGKLLRLPLGNDCVERMTKKLEKVHADIEASREVASSTNFVE